jgi:hypothetical protein
VLKCEVWRWWGELRILASSCLQSVCPYLRGETKLGSVQKIATARNVKKSSPATRHGGALGERRHSSYTFTTSAIDGGRWVVNITPRPRFTFGTHCTGGWVGPRAGLDTEDRGKILCPCRGSNPARNVGSQGHCNYAVWICLETICVWGDQDVTRFVASTSKAKCLLLNLKLRMVTICTSCCEHQSVCIMFLWVLYASSFKQRLFP